MIKKVFIEANPGKKQVKETLAALSKLLKKKGVEAFFGPGAGLISGKKPSNPLKCEAQLFIALGGDGTFLKLARSIFPSSAPMLGINLGSLGFLSEIKLPEMKKAVEKVLDGDYHIDERMALEACLGPGKRLTALNEFVIAGTTGRVISLSVSVDGEFVNTYSADGIIISTPTGSTAYSLSAGGPIVAPNVKGIIITPICPHSLTNRPLLVPEESLIELKLELRGGTTVIATDGQVRYELKKNALLTIKKAKGAVNMIIPSRNSYFRILREKLRWG